MDCHTVVIGLGAVGSSVLYQLANRNCDVIGIDQFAPPHAHGSTHGESRMTRLAMAEGSPYLQLAKRSYEIWRRVEREASCSLMTVTGGLLIAPGSGGSDCYINRTITAAEREHIAHEVLEFKDIRRRFPLFKVNASDIAYFEPGAGILRPERCIEAFLTLARIKGARTRLNERVVAIDDLPRGIRVVTEQAEITARVAVLAVGPWLPNFLPVSLAHWFKIYRQVQFWFAAKRELEHIVQAPVFDWELPGRKKGLYGFPSTDGRESLKVASEQYETLTTPEQFDATVSFHEERAMREHFIQPFLPMLDGDCVKAAACIYTMTPDSGFVIDYHPMVRRLIVASPCSGHGFKHSAAVGEAIAELAMTGASTVDLGAFRLARFVS